MNSVIRQFQVDATMTGTESESLALQQLLSRISHDQIIPVIETVLQRHASEQNHCYFERLMLDIGEVDFERLDKDLALKVGECLERLLQVRMAASSAGLFKDADAAESPQQQSLAGVAEQAWLFFLANGRLPWSFSLDAGQSLEAVVLAGWRQSSAGVQAKTATPLGFNAAAIELLQSPAARLRLFSQFSGFFCETLLARLSPKAKDLLQEVKRKLAELSASDKEKANFVGQLIESLFEMLAAQKTLMADEIVWKCWNQIETTLPEADSRLWRAWLASHWPAAADRLPGKQAGGESMTKQDRDSFAHDRRSSVIHQRLTAAADDELREGIFVGNAGLALLHPFLPQLFQALGIAESQVLRQPARALLLLHYLATGQSAAPEYELLLPKLLCNIPLNEPLAPLPELSMDDQQEADALLAAVIRHWSALGDTAIDSLRGTFLLRPGKVTRRQDGDWLVQVESRSFDVLLNQLPWGISMFQLPWMQHLCWVEWRYESEC